MSKVMSHNSVTDSDINHAETHLVTITVFLSSGMMSVFKTLKLVQT
jgi:hypothetical protein